MLDAPARVTGRLAYVLNHDEPGCLRGRLLRSPHAHARITSTAVSRAAALPDVTVLTGAELETWPGISPFYGPLVDDTPVLATDCVRYSGEPVAAVAAPDEDTADAALELIDIEY